jgi:hypothetical protein
MVVPPVPMVIHAKNVLLAIVSRMVNAMKFVVMVSGLFCRVMMETGVMAMVVLRNAKYNLAIVVSVDHRRHLIRVLQALPQA